MSPFLFILGCILILALMVLLSMYFIYNDRAEECRTYADPQCYSDWTCHTATAGLENLYDSRLTPYLNSCGTGSTDTSCPCARVPDANDTYDSPYGLTPGITENVGASATISNVCA